MKLLILRSHIQLVTVALSLLVCLVPLSAFAVSKPSCVITAVTPHGSAKVTSGENIKVFLQQGEVLKTTWQSNNTKRAFNDDRYRIFLAGTATSSPEKTETFTYSFEDGNKKATCEVTVEIVKGSIDASALTTKSHKPKLSGEVDGIKNVTIEIYENGENDPIYTSKTIKVRNGNWKERVTRSLPDGEYLVVLKGDKSADIRTIASEILTVGSPEKTTKNASDASFVVELVPLLNGGTARASSVVPVSYLQVVNIGKSNGTVESFSIKQNGSAATNAVVGFIVSDNRSSAITTIGSASKPVVFKNGIATLPVDAAVDSKSSRLFTIKAILAPNLITNLGKQLKLDVAAIETNGSEKDAFPIRGTTWTIGY